MPHCSVAHVVMMLRLLRVLIAGRFGPRVAVHDTIGSRFRVGLGDLDVLRHMTNGRYFSILDAGRMDLYVRSGAWRRMTRLGWYPVVAAQTLDYRRSLGYRTRFTVTTRLLGFDQRNAYFEQAFVADGHVCAQGVVGVRYLRRSGGSVSPAEFAEEIPGLGDAHPLPEWVARWADDVRASRSRA